MNDILVQIGLNDLYGLKASANCADIYKRERDDLEEQLEAAKKKIAELQKEIVTLKEERPN